MYFPKHRYFTKLFPSDYIFRYACGTQLAIPSNVKALASRCHPRHRYRISTLRQVFGSNGKYPLVESSQERISSAGSATQISAAGYHEGAYRSHAKPTSQIGNYPSITTPYYSRKAQRYPNGHIVFKKRWGKGKANGSDFRNTGSGPRFE